MAFQMGNCGCKPTFMGPHNSLYKENHQGKLGASFIATENAEDQTRMVLSHQPQWQGPCPESQMKGRGAMNHGAGGI